MAHPLSRAFAEAACLADALVKDRTPALLARAFVDSSEISRLALASSPEGEALPDDTLEAMLHRISWCRAHQNVRVTSVLGPASLDQRVASLDAASRAEAAALGAADDDIIVRVVHDVRVQPGRSDRTDDALYESNEVIRERIPRGLAFLEARAVRAAELVSARAAIAAGKDAAKAEAALVGSVATADGPVDADGIAEALAGAKKVDADAAPLGRALRVDMPVRGLTKFTGGVGDDDDKLPGAGAAEPEAAAAGSAPAWQSFFTADMGSATHVAVMGKANGESGHLGVVWDAWLGRYVAVAGSKNVHVAFRPTFSVRGGAVPAGEAAASSGAAAAAASGSAGDDDDDDEGGASNPDLDDMTWKQGRFSFALPMARVADQLLTSNSRKPYEHGAAPAAARGLPPAPSSLAEALLYLLSTGRTTLCFEHVSPAWLHVERCALDRPELVAIGWQSARLCAAPGLSRGLNPLVGRPLALALGVGAVSEELIPVSRLREQMAATRQLYGVEGHVLYFVDASGHVIGLLKKKAVWYIVVRAFREKAKGMLSALARHAAEAESGRRPRPKGRTGPASQLEGARRKWEGTGARFGAGAGEEPGPEASLAAPGSPLHPSQAMAWAAGGAATSSDVGAETIRRLYHLRTALRVHDIQSWVRMSEEARLRWTALGHGLVEHCFREAEAGRLDSGRADTAFPLLWDEYLDAAGEDDHVTVGATEA